MKKKYQNWNDDYDENLWIDYPEMVWLTNQIVLNHCCLYIFVCIKKSIVD